MDDVDLRRLRDDLAAIRAATGCGLPFSGIDVAVNVGLAACGACVAVWGALAPWEHRWLLLAPLAVVVTFTAIAASRAFRKRAESPEAWREQRSGFLIALVLVPLAIGYLGWERWIGMPRHMTGAAVVFGIGVALLATALASRPRRYHAGFGVPLMGFGLVIPFASAQQVIIAAGLALLAGGLAAASIQHWQLRARRNELAAD